MKEPHIFYGDNGASCSKCGTGPEQIKDGCSENFKIHVIRNLKNPGKYDENLLWWAECKVCKRSTKTCESPYLYF